MERAKRDGFGGDMLVLDFLGVLLLMQRRHVIHRMPP